MFITLGRVVESFVRKRWRKMQDHWRLVQFVGTSEKLNRWENNVSSSVSKDKTSEIGPENQIIQLAERNLGVEEK